MYMYIHLNISKILEKKLAVRKMIDFLFLVFNATFSNISAISWRPVLVNFFVHFSSCCCSLVSINFRVCEVSSLHSSLLFMVELF